MTIKNKNNIGANSRKFSGKKIMLVTALLSGGVVIRVNNHINNSFGNATKEVINFDLTLETTDVLINDEGIFYVGQGTPIDNFSIYDFVTILDESGNVIADKDVTLEWDVKEYFEGTTFGTKGEYLITITATTADGRTGELEYKLVVKEGHIFEEIKEIGNIELDITNDTSILDFQEHFRVLNSTTGQDTGAPILSTLKDEDVRTLGTKQVIFYTELDGIKFTNSVDISVVDTVAPVVNLKDTFDSNENGFDWDNSERTITIKELDKTLEEFHLEDFASCYDASGECEFSWNFDEIMKDKITTVGTYTVTINAIDSSGNEGTIEILVNVSTVDFEFKPGINEIAFELYYDAKMDATIHSVGLFYDIRDAAGNLIVDPNRISWNLEEFMLREIGEYNLTIEVLDELFSEVIGSRDVTVNVKDTTVPVASLNPGVKTTFDIEVDQFNSIDNLYMYLDGLTNIDDLVNVTDNSGVWGYRFELNGQPLTDALLRTTGVKHLTLVFFDYDKEGNILNEITLNDASGFPESILINVIDTKEAVVIITNEIIDLEVMQNATKEMIEITNYAEISDNSGSFTWELRVKGAQEAVMDYANMLGKITDPAGVELELVVTDASGNITYEDMLLIVRDTHAPILEVKKSEETININPSASEINVYRNIDSYISVTDNSGKAQLTWNFDQVLNFSVAGIYEVVITATDDAGNTSEEVITFTVVDNEAPTVIVNTKVITIEANEYTNKDDFEFDINLNDYITTNDNSGTVPTITFDYSNVDFGEIGTYEVIITATDEAGNQSNNLIEIKVIAGAPKVNVLKDQVIVDTMKIENNVFTGIKIEIKDGKILIERASATDESEVLSHLTMENLVEFLTISGETIESAIWDLTSLDVKSIGTNDIQLTVTNNFGKTVTETIEFVVIYEYDSLIKVSGDNYIDIEIDTNKTMTPDWFKSEYEVTDYVEYRAGGGQATIIWRTAELNLVDFSTVGTYIITASITDGHTDTDQVSLTLNIIDTTGPELTVTQPNAFEINAQTASNIDINNYASATDNSGQPVSLSWNLSTQVNFTKVGTYVVIVKAVDASGNETTKEITFEVEDTQPPVLTVNPGMDTQTIEINSRDASNFNVNSFVTTTDNSGVAPELEWNIQDVDFSTVNSYTVEISATDKEGNKSNVVTITFVIEDTIAPSIDIDPNGLEELKVEIATKSESDYSDWLEDYVTVTDNSGESITPSWDITGVDFNTFGTYMVTITAVDSSNNTITQVVSFGVTDTTAPVITIKDDKEITTLEVFDGKLADFTLADFATCSDASTCTIEWDIQNVDFSTVGTYVVTIKAVDIYGNESRAEITIEVQDTTKPVIEITRLEILVAMDKFSSIDFDINNFAKVTDNYDNSVSLTWNIDDVDFNAEGDYTVTITAIDSSGNEAEEKTVKFVVEEINIILEEVSPFEIEVTQSPDVSNILIETYFKATQEDGSAVDEITWNVTDQMLTTYGSYGVTLTIKFESTKSVEIEVTLEVIDTVGPTIIVDNPSLTIELGDTQAFDNLTATDFVTISDNSNDFTYSWDFDSVVDKTIEDTYEITITAIDVAGNETEAKVNLFVEDTTDPTLELNDDFNHNNMIWSKSNTSLTLLQSDKTLSDIDLWELVTASDESTGGLNISWDLTAVNLDDVGHYNITISIEDASGNTITQPITVNVLRATPILNDFNVDKSHSSVVVNFDITNLNEALTYFSITLEKPDGTIVDTYENITPSADSYTINHVFTTGVTSNTEYKVVLEYKYSLQEDQSTQVETVTDTKDVKTLSYSQNDVLGTITDTYLSHREIEVDYEINNDLGLMTSAQLVLLNSTGDLEVHDITLTDSSGNHRFLTLTPNNDYTVELRISYNFNDGNGEITKVEEFRDLSTLSYSEHDVITDITGITQSPSTVSVDYNITDTYGLIIAGTMKAKIYNASTMVEVGTTKDLTDLSGTIAFINLDANTSYIVVIEAELDLQDGTTMVKETGSHTTTEAYHFDEITVNISNVIVDYNEIIFEYEAFDPNGLLVGNTDADKLKLSINGQKFDLGSLDGTVKLSDHLNEVDSDASYDVQIHFHYDLKDGVGSIEHDTDLYGFVESTRAYNLDQDLTLTSHNLASDMSRIYIDYSLRNLNLIGDMSTLAVTIDDLNGNSQKILFSALGATSLNGSIELDNINGAMLDPETVYQISITIDYDLEDGNGIQSNLLLLDSAQIHTKDVPLVGYNVVSTLTRGYTFINADFDVLDDGSHGNNLLDSFKIALLDENNVPVTGYDYVPFNATTGQNTFKFENLLSNATYTIVYRIDNPYYTAAAGEDEFIEISRRVTTRTYDTNLINVDYTLTQGLTYLHLEDIQVLNTNELYENITYNSVIAVITYTTRDGQLITVERDLGSLTEGDTTSAVFSGIQSNTDVNIEFRLEYDLKDGEGIQSGDDEIVRTSDSNTLEYDFTFVIENDEVLVTGLTPGFTGNHLVIFQEVEGYPVKDIKADAFYSDSVSFAELTIPRTLETIGQNAFRNINLTTINLTNTLEIIPTVTPRAISDTNTQGILVIGDNAFRDNSITSFDFTTTDTIGVSAFRNNAMTEVVLSDTVSYVATEAFVNARISKLTTGSLLSDDMFGADTFVGNQITDLTIGNGLFKHDTLGVSSSVFSSNGLNLIYSDTASGELEEFAWYYHATREGYSRVIIKNLTIGNNISRIGQYAFLYNQFDDVKIGDAVTEVGNYAFYETGINTLTLGKTLVDVQVGAFGKNNISTLSFPETLVSIQRDAFISNNIKTLVLPDSVTYVGDAAFGDNQMENLVIGELLSDENFGEQTFAANDIKNLTIGNIGFKHDSLGNSNSVFSTSGLNLVYADTAVGEIQEYAWYYHATNEGYSRVVIKNVTLGNQITRIGRYAFLYNQLDHVEIGDSVEEIGNYAFYETGINTVNLGASIIDVQTGAFGRNNISALTFPETLATIGDDAFISNSISSLTLPNSVSYVGNAAFAANSMIDLVIGELLSDENFGEQSFASNDIANLTVGHAGFKHDSLGNSDSVFSSNGLNLVYEDTANGEIESNAWYYHATREGYSRVILNNVTIGNNISKIGSYAFLYNLLDDVKIGNSVEVIDNYAFYETGINTLTLGDSLININTGAFGKNNISSFVFPETLKTIGNDAFYDNSINSLTLPNSVNKIGDSAFSVNSMSTLVIGELLSRENFGDNSFVGNDITDLTIGNIDFRYDSLGTTSSVFASSGFNLTYADTAIGEISSYAWRSGSGYSDAHINSLTIGTGVTRVGSYAFDGNEIPSVTLQDNVTSIGNNSFSNNEIATLNLSNTLSSIPQSSFENNKIASLVIPNSVTTLSNGAFRNNLINNLTLSTSITDIPDYAFYINKLSNFVIPSHIQTIGQESFANNEITSLAVPNTITYIGDRGFANNDMTTLDVGSDIFDVNLGSETFAGNKINDLTLGNTELGYESFGTTTSVFLNSGFHLTYADTASGRIKDDAWYYHATTAGRSRVQVIGLSISDGVTEIGKYAFLGNVLTSVTIGDDVTLIDNYAFYHAGVRALDLGQGVITVGTGAFKAVSGASGISALSLPQTLTTIGNEAFMYNDIDSLEIPNTVMTIGNSAFSNNEITNLTFGEQITNDRLGDYAFLSNKVSTLTIGNTDITYESFSNTESTFSSSGFALIYADTAEGEIRKEAWRYTSGKLERQITSLTIGSKIDAIGYFTFSGNNIRTLSSLKNVETIDDYGFYQAGLVTTGLETSKVKTIGNYGFYGNDITSLEMPSTLTTLGNSAFGYNSIREVTLKNTVTSIGEYLFRNNSLSKVVIEDGLEPGDIGYRPFYMNSITDLTVGSTAYMIDQFSLDPGDVFSSSGFKLTYSENASGEIPKSAWDAGSGETSTPNEVVFSTKITSLADRAFMYNQIDHLVIPDNIKSIGAYAFYQSEISTLDLGEGVETILGYVFYGSRLTTVRIPASVKTLGTQSFYRAIGDNLKTVYFDGGVVLPGYIFDDSPTFYDKDGKIITP